MMIGFSEAAPLEKLIAAVTAANDLIKRSDDKIRLFRAPLEKIV